MSLRNFFSLKREKDTKDLITIPLSPSEMYRCEKAIEWFKIPSFKSYGELRGIANELKLEVEDTKEEYPLLTGGKIACLAPSVNSEKSGAIYIKKSAKDNCWFAHELVHYYVDVGEGERVEDTYFRDKDFNINKGPIGEQRVEYIAISQSFPLTYQELSKKLIALDKENPGLSNRMKFIKSLSEQYDLKPADVLRRVVEVRDIDKYRLSKGESPATPFYPEGVSPSALN